jgi:predicted Zn-dependent peptidase
VIAAFLLAFAGYSEATLDNGLRVVLIEHRANPMVASSVVVGAGVVHEPEARGGASHLLEHLLFNGTATRTQRELYDAVDRVGAYNNATTREDHTLFSVLIQKEFAEVGLEIQADMLFRSTIPAENFDKEKGIVLEEMAKDASDPGYLATEAFRAFAYAGTPLAKPVLGTRASIGAIPRDEVVAYWKERYVPSNMLLVVMGDFDAPSMLASVKRTFGAAPKAKAGPPNAAGSWPALPKENLRTAPLDAPRIYLNGAFPLGLSPHDPLVPAVELLLDALAGADDAPLRRQLTSGADPAAATFGLGTNLRTGPWSTVEFQATLAPGKPFAPVLDALGRALRDLGPASPARSRIDLVRAAARSREVLEADQIHYYAMTHAEALLEAPAGWLAGAARRFDAVTDAELDRAAAHLARAIAAARISVSGPGMTQGTASWTPPEPSPRVATRGRVDRPLACGARVIAERNDDSQVFAVHALLRPRAASEPAGKEGIASFLHRLLPKGTVGSDGPALAARLARLGAQVKADDDSRVPFDDYYTTPEFSFVRLELPADGWREGISLLAEMLRQPRLDPVDVESVRKDMLDLQSRRQASSRNRAVDAFEGAIAPGHPLTRPVLGTAASIGAITVDDLGAFHRDYVTGSHLALTVVSPVDAEEVAQALDGAFAGLPAGAPAPAVPPPPVTSAPAELRGDALKDQVTVVLGYTFDAPDDERPALALAGALLSDELAFELREKRGLAYQMGASIAPWGGRMRLLVTMGTRKENLDAALSGLREGIAAFVPKDDAAVKRAAAAMRGRLLMRRLTRINQAYFLALDVLDGRPPGGDLARIDALLKLDREKVATAAKRYLDAAKLVAVVR